MKVIKFDKYSDMLDECLNYLDEKDNVTILCDYGLAKEICELVDEDDFEETSIELDENIFEYYIGKLENKFFCIEPATVRSGEYKGRLKYSESDHAIVINDIIELSEVSIDDIEEFVHGEKSIVMFDYDEYDIDEDFDVSQEVDRECEDCESCEYYESCKEEGCLEDEEDENLRALYNFYTRIMEANGCPECTLRVMVEMMNHFLEVD